MHVPDAVAEVYITEQLNRRLAHEPNYDREKLAIKQIALQMVNDPTSVLPRLVDLAIEMCDATAGGISIYENDSEVFRWHHLRGNLAKFTGATTPRNYSPCGITLDHKSAVLVQRPERVYSWLVDAQVSLPECLLVPLYVGDKEPLGTLWIVSEEVEHFNERHASMMEELAGFTGMAMHMIRAEERLKTALEDQETLTREMGHRVKNLFAVTDAMIRMTARDSATKDEFASRLSGRVHALGEANALVRRSFSDGQSIGANLKELIERILTPYDHSRFAVAGNDFALSDGCTNNLALVFHELATNSAKYGALAAENGLVSVKFENVEEVIKLCWRETNGPAPATPSAKGFGSKLIQGTIDRMGGNIGYDWRPTGLVVRIDIPTSALAA